jgi:hypothetical protein
MERRRAIVQKLFSRRKETSKKEIYIHNNKITIAQIMSNKTENWFIKSFFEQHKKKRAADNSHKKEKK